MSNQPKLILPNSYEDLVKELSNDLAVMTKFVVPVEEAERELAITTQFIKHSGKVVFLLGSPGIGKSTFIQSLTWSSPLSILEIKEINANELGSSEKKLELLYQEILALVTKRQKDKPGLFTVVINYLEDFSGQTDDDVRAFFRDINGLLRNNPVLIIWPVTQKREANKMLELASHVSGTVFADKPILEFYGPPIDRFPKIAKNTIAALNPNSNLDDFQLTENDFVELLDQIKQQGPSKCLIRDYLKMINSTWIERSGAIKEALSQIPKTTEVWFVVCYPGAESVVSQFASKSTETELAWNSNH